jgi:hypothetical protein
MGSRSKPPCTTCAGATSIVRHHRRIRLGLPHLRLRPAGPPHRRLQRQRSSERQPPCTSASAAAPSRASPSRARSSGPASSWPTASSTWTSAAGKAIELPREETERRWQATTPAVAHHARVTYGVTRDQMMARHKANHIQVAYAKPANLDWRSRSAAPVRTGRRSDPDLFDPGFIGLRRGGFRF